MRIRLTKSMATPARSLLLATAVFALTPAAAPAATVHVGPNGLVYEAAPGETNNLDAGDAAPGRQFVTDSGAPLVVGPGCAAGSRVLCAASGGVFRLGDRNDRGHFFGNFGTSYIYGEQGDDDVVSAGSTAYGYGGAGDDHVKVSSNGRSYAWGGPGNDIVEGIGVWDLLRGGRGNDTLRATGNGPESAYGGPGDDRLELGGNSTHSDGKAGGGTGNDTLVVAAGSRAGFELRGGPGNDFITGGTGPDMITGGAGGDHLAAAERSADSPPDTLDCGPGTDRVSVDPQDVVAANCEHVQVLAPRPSP